ncbi:hypothetical protein [Tateyamaria sp.]|uniref:hypothetical protein n=1 Tax=Tateyamaria sp. TaxID=1929288 RepID=UPI00329B2054
MTLGAVDQCEANQLDFARVFRNQFVLSECPDIKTPGWTTKTVNGWHFQHCQDLPVSELRTKDGSMIGFVCGVVIDSEGALVDAPQILNQNSQDAGFWKTVDTYCIGLSGRYIVMILQSLTPRIYTDPVADYGVVYDPNSRKVASSLMLALERPIHPNPIMPWADIRVGNLQYSLGHTRDFYVKRLFGNHYLGLKDFRPIRFWPREDTDLETRSIEDSEGILDRIHARLSQNMRGLLSSGTCILPLSGGRDSRCLLGAGIDHIKDAQFVFSWRFHRQSGRDSETAKIIADRMGLEHRQYWNKKGTKADRMRFLLANGYATFGPELRTVHIHKDIPKNLTVLRGNIMGILRATNWARQREGALNIQHGIKRLRIYGANATEKNGAFWRNDFLAWYETLPSKGKAKVYDLAWLDITLPHSQGARFHGFPEHFFMNPFSDRYLLQLSMQLPLQIRRNDSAYAGLLDRTVPDLKDIPYV